MVQRRSAARHPGDPNATAGHAGTGAGIKPVLGSESPDGRSFVGRDRHDRTILVNFEAAFSVDNASQVWMPAWHICCFSAFVLMFAPKVDVRQDICPGQFFSIAQFQQSAQGAYLHVSV
jgi:hypothetical protein